MKWQNEKMISSDSPAREKSVHHSSATHSPNIEDKQKTHHEHKWDISSNHWRCSTCGKTYG
ncbi:MAG TPA: hypothetical protein VJ571_06080 [Candidatus Nitrosotalea sp.]|nr:hypothetical protein [Candidatus Nitrosotalea sp.]